MIAGIERFFDQQLQSGETVQLSIDLRLQRMVEREIARVAGGLHRALRGDPRGRLDADAGAEIEPGGIGRLARGLLSGSARVLIGHGREVGAIALETGGADVGEVVGDHAHPRVLRFETGAGDVKG